MKIKVNRNNLWTDIFAETLAKSGVINCCISPGSRSTPLALSFAKINKIKKYVIIDERSSGFFALGLAKSSNLPTVVITTSGTAVAELYPSIIEAYLSRIPLIICTADRPPELINKGANQTINQTNIYSNQIRAFFDAGVPVITEKRIKALKKIAVDSFFISNFGDKGPVHINLPFRLPLERFSYDISMEEKLIEKYKRIIVPVKKEVQKIRLKENDSELVRKITSSKKGIIISAPDNFLSDYQKELLEFSSRKGFVIFPDGGTSLRYQVDQNNNLINNYDLILRTIEIKPDVIILTGRNITSKTLLNFISESKASKIFINEFGDNNDPTASGSSIIKSKPKLFFNYLNKITLPKKNTNEVDFANRLIRLNNITENYKLKMINNKSVLDEFSIPHEIINNLPGQVNLFISNSMPVRDFDIFASSNIKVKNVFTNRGASGIDGINSTALAIAESSSIPVVLVTGDLSFYHDLNGLQLSKKYNIPLIVVLINNNGGGIFNMLPISKDKEFFNDYFITPLNIEFKKIVEGYGGKLIHINSKEHFKKEIIKSYSRKSLTVLEIRFNSKISSERRKKFITKISDHIRNAK